MMENRERRGLRARLLTNTRMVSLGALLAERDEKGQAVRWYRKAADARRRDG